MVSIINTIQSTLAIIPLRYYVTLDIIPLLIVSNNFGNKLHVLYIQCSVLCFVNSLVTNFCYYATLVTMPLYLGPNGWHNIES